MTERLAVGTNTTPSADFTVTAGTSPIYHLKTSTDGIIGAGVNVIFYIKVGTLYFPMFSLSAASPGRRLNGGVTDTTWRCQRDACIDPSGVEEQ